MEKTTKIMSWRQNLELIIYVIVGANWPQRYYSGWEGWAYGPITQSEDEDISEDDQLRKR